MMAGGSGVMADAFHGSDVIGASVSHQYGHSCGRHLPGVGEVADALYCSCS